MSIPASWRASGVTWPLSSTVGAGLHGAAATVSRVAWLDPAGRLLYRGVPIESLVGGSSFEEIAFLLLCGSRRDDDPDGWMRFGDDLRGTMTVPDRVRSLLETMGRRVSPLDRLRAGISELGAIRGAETRESAARLLGRLAALLAAIAADERGLGLDLATGASTVSEHLLLPFLGTSPDPRAVGALDTTLIAYADDGLAPQTFATLVVASCLGDSCSALVAGLGAAGGTRASGAAVPIAEALLTLDGPDRVDLWIDHRLHRRERLPGFGHRFLGARDPRLSILRTCAETLVESETTVVDPPDARRMLSIARALEERGTARLAGKGVGANAHIYGALVLTLLGATPRVVPFVVAFARFAGALARIEEYLGHNRIFRPLDRYVGPEPRPFVPLEAR
jgi:citrate synthase